MPYPCCCCTPDSVTPPPACPSGNCLLVPQKVTINPTTSVLPCGASGSVDIATLSDLTNCTGNVVWQLVSYDETAFSTAGINSSGLLSFTTTSAAVVGQFYVFLVKAMCDNSILSAFVEVYVPIKDGCYATVCDPGESCNPCTGNCAPIVPDQILS